jgi:hypothetical protein
MLPQQAAQALAEPVIVHPASPAPLSGEQALAAADADASQSLVTGSGGLVVLHV